MLKRISKLIRRILPRPKDKWYRNENGYLHRDGDLPAVEYHGVCKEWWVNGKRHRENDLPAIEWDDGGKEWFVNDERHRVGGPAMIYPDGIDVKFWWMNDVQLPCRTDAEYERYMKMKAFW